MKVYTNVDEVIRNLELFNMNLQIGLKGKTEELGKYCKDTAKANVLSYDKDPTNSELVRSGIQLFLEGTISGYSKAIIEAGHKDSKFYEYGTGIVGSETPHPESEKAGWLYNLSTPYKRISSVTGQEGWFHKFPVGVRFTSGQPASAFMFKAYYSTKAKANALLKECFNEALKGR